MQSKNSYLFADVDLGEVRTALSEWSWFLKGKWSPLLVSAVGDVFLENETGQVFRLDTGTGEIEPVASTVSAFSEALQSPASERDWLLAPVIDELRSQGKTLGRGQCYGFTILPVFKEGSYKAANRFVISALEHIRVTGNMHLQIKDLADGDKVRIRVVE
jgi:type VI secretion system (T6SS) immunity protein Tdi1